jgi:acyl-ACP thioesterase
VRSVRASGSEALLAMDPPDTGRFYRHRATVLLGDATPEGRARLDAIARVLHDAATLDNEDAPVADKGPWVLRGITLEITRWPRYLEQLEALTWCSGTGPAWAARATHITSGTEVLVGSEALWVQIDGATGRPRRLGDEFLACFGPSARGRVVAPRLGLVLPDEAPEDLVEVPLRYTDLDVMGHVNNAIYLALLEESLARRHEPLPDGLRLRIEFLSSLAAPGVAMLARYAGRPAVLRMMQEGRTAAIAEWHWAFD